MDRTGGRLDGILSMMSERVIFLDGLDGSVPLAGRGIGWLGCLGLS